MTQPNGLEALNNFRSAREQLIALWREGMSSFCPSEGQWNVWLQVNDPKTMMLAVLKTTKKYSKLNGAMDADYLIRYTSSVANEIRRTTKGMSQ